MENEIIKIQKVLNDIVYPTIEEKIQFGMQLYMFTYKHELHTIIGSDTERIFILGETSLTDSFKKSDKIFNSLIGKPIDLQLILDAIHIKYKHIGIETKVIVEEDCEIIIFGKYDIRFRDKSLNNDELYSLAELFQIDLETT